MPPRSTRASTTPASPSSTPPPPTACAGSTTAQTPAVSPPAPASLRPCVPDPLPPSSPGCLLGRLLPRLLLASARSVLPADIAIAHTPAGKPYYASPRTRPSTAPIAPDQPCALTTDHPGPRPPARIQRLARRRRRRHGLRARPAPDPRRSGRGCARRSAARGARRRGRHARRGPAAHDLPRARPRRRRHGASPRRLPPSLPPFFLPTPHVR